LFVNFAKYVRTSKWVNYLSLSLTLSLCLFHSPILYLSISLSLHHPTPLSLPYISLILSPTLTLSHQSVYLTLKRLVWFSKHITQIDRGQHFWWMFYVYHIIRPSQCWLLVVEVDKQLLNWKETVRLKLY